MPNSKKNKFNPSATKYTPEEQKARKKFLADSYAKEGSYTKIHRENMLGVEVEPAGTRRKVREDFLNHVLVDPETPESILEAEQELEELERLGLL